MPRRYYLLLTLITLTGAFLRLWQLAAVPPGLHYDLAATALLGNDVAFNGYRPIFISAYTGHEALYYYWLALWFRLVGSSVFRSRIAGSDGKGRKRFCFFQYSIPIRAINYLQKVGNVMGIREIFSMKNQVGFQIFLRALLRVVGN